jgi:hypothetical protein
MSMLAGEFVVRVASDPADLDQVRALWREYWKSKSFPGVYACDGGALADTRR